MNLKNKIKELKNIRRFKKEFKKLSHKSSFLETIDLCDYYLDYKVNMQKNIELIISYKIYAYLALDNIDAFMTEKDKVNRNDLTVLIKYYELLILLDNNDLRFDSVYEEFLSYKLRPETGLTTFLILKKEIDNINESLKNKTTLNKTTVDHIDKSNLPVLKRLLKKTNLYNENKKGTNTQ